jgi:hypothetical protein
VNEEMTMNANRINLTLRALGAALPVVALLLCGSPLRGGTTGATYYTCTVDISGGTNGCTDGIITATTSTGIYRVLTVNLGASYQRLDLFVNVCNPTGWWTHLADSPTTNGFGGDSGTTNHDAEAYILDTGFQLFTMDNSRGFAWPSYRSTGVAAATGCYRAQWVIYESRTMFDDDGNPADTPRVDVNTSRGFERSPYAETDAEDPTGANANLWYVGLNRTVGSAARLGTGVNKACFVLSTTTAPTPAILSALCP